jgi:hypothetical protein
MNDLVVSISIYGTEANVGGMSLGEVKLEPLFDIVRGKAWSGTLKIGDSTIGVYAYTLHTDAPLDKEDIHILTIK